MTLADLLVHAALALWLGSVVFFSLVAAPALFDELDRDRAGDAVNAVFPRYYQFGLAMGAVALLTWAVGTLVLDYAAPPLLADGGVVVAFAATAYARFGLLPKMEAAGSDAFAQYHKQSLVLNGVALLGVALAFVVLNG